jgi:acyl-CoA synthetase (AMP-forming)/AMP-acid ligase II
VANFGKGFAQFGMQASNLLNHAQSVAGAINNIYPQDIEAIVNRTPGVHPGRCVAIGVGNMGAGTESLVVIAETEETDPVRKQEIQSLIFDTVAAETDLVPADVRLVEHMWLHKSSAGKISRRRNLERYLELQDIEHAEVARPGRDATAGAGAFGRPS